MRKLTAIAMCAVIYAMPANAINNYNTTNLTCARTQAILQQEGAAVLHYRNPHKPSIPLYDVYAKNSGYCGYGQYAKPYFVPTKDNPKCRARICKDQSISR
ncbi:hypothetical protein AAFN47_05550 [Hoeflea sp. CAU 1731]